MRRKWLETKWSEMGEGALSARQANNKIYGKTNIAAGFIEVKYRTNTIIDDVVMDGALD